MTAERVDPLAVDFGPDIEAHMRRLVDDAPPLTEEQKARLRVLLAASPARTDAA